MSLSNSSVQVNHLVDQAVQAAGQALADTQQRANGAVDGAVNSMAQVGEQADALARRGADALGRGSQQLRQSARQAGDSTLDYIREEPVKAVLIAAAAGAALTVLARLVTRSRA